MEGRGLDLPQLRTAGQLQVAQMFQVPDGVRQDGGDGVAAEVEMGE